MPEASNRGLKVTGIHMPDKIRHRPGLVPKGQMPNWALVVCIASAFALVALARTIV